VTDIFRCSLRLLYQIRLPCEDGRNLTTENLVMIAVTFIIVIIIIFNIGRLGALIFPRNVSNDFDLDQYLTGRTSNLAKLMRDIAEMGEVWLARSGRLSLLRINAFLFVVFGGLIVVYELSIAGPWLVGHFLWNGFTIDVDQRETLVLAQNWPNLVFDRYIEGNRLHAGEAVLQMLLLIAIGLLALSATSSISIYTNLRLIRWLGRDRKAPVYTGLTLVGAFIFSLCCDLLFVVLLFAFFLLGKPLGLFVEENIQAKLTDNSLTYGFGIGHRYDPHGSAAIFSTGLMVSGIDFDELNDEAPVNGLIDWALPYGFDKDAAALCDRYNIRPTCRYRFRSVFFRHFHPAAETYLPAFSNLLVLASSSACGHDLWSPMPTIGTGAAQSAKLGLPFFASLGALFLSKALIVPALIGIVFLNYAIIRIARYTARSSERGHLIIALNAAAVLGAPPVLAILTLSFAIRFFICA
jgi:hypothetical protein